MGSRLVVLLLLVLAGCQTRPSRPAFGSYSEILVFWPDTVSTSAFPILRQGLEASVLQWPEPEPAFQVQLRPSRDFASARDQKNLIVVTRMDGSGSPGDPALQLLGRAELDQVRTDGAGSFLMRDVHARGQVLVVLAATSDAKLDSLLGVQTPAVTQAFEEATVRRLRDDLLRGETTSYDENGPGFSIRMPTLYDVRRDPPAWPHAIEFSRRAPTRILTVFWIESVDSSRARSHAFCRGVQRDVLWRLHGDALLEERTRVEPGRLGPYRSLELVGVWQNPKEVGGGPLRTHFVYDARTHRLYGVQALVFAPGRKKVPLLRELKALAETFRIGEDG